MKSEIKYLILLACFTLPLRASAFTREQATTIAKSRFATALEQGYQFAQACRVIPQDCQLGPREQIIVANVWSELLDLEQLPTLEFRSESADPGFFQINGAVRIAKTGDLPGGVIYINLDLLAVPDAEWYRPLTFPEAMAVIMHELGHHHDRKVSPRMTEEELDVLANKIRALMLQYADVRTLSHNQWPALAVGETISLEHFIAPGAKGQFHDFSYLFLTGPFGMIDLSRMPVGRLTCPRSYYRDRLDFEGKPYWMYIRNSQFQFTTLSNFSLKISGQIDDAVVYCINEISTSSSKLQSFSGYKNGIFELNLKVNDNGTLTVDPSTLSLTMTTPPDEFWQ